MDWNTALGWVVAGAVGVLFAAYVVVPLGQAVTRWRRRYDYDVD